MDSNSTRTPVRARGAISKLAPNANDITPARGAGAVSAITPGNDDGQVNDVGGEVGCQVGSVSRRARSYMLTYKSLEIVNEDSKDQSNEKSNDITHNHIENMQKKFRSHRAALDFD